MIWLVPGLLGLFSLHRNIIKIYFSKIVIISCAILGIILLLYRRSRVCDPFFAHVAQLIILDWSLEMSGLEPSNVGVRA